MAVRSRYCVQRSDANWNCYATSLKSINVPIKCLLETVTELLNTTEIDEPLGL